MKKGCLMMIITLTIVKRIDQEIASFTLLNDEWMLENAEWMVNEWRTLRNDVKMMNFNEKLQKKPTKTPII